MDALRRAPEMLRPLGTYMYNRSEGSSCTWMLNTSLGPPGTIPAGPAGVTQRAHMLRPGRHLHTLLLCCCFCCRTYTRPRCTSSPRSQPATQPTPRRSNSQPLLPLPWVPPGADLQPNNSQQEMLERPPPRPQQEQQPPCKQSASHCGACFPSPRPHSCLLPLPPGGKCPSCWDAPRHQPLQAWRSYTPTRHLQCCWLLLVSCCRCSRPAAAADDQVAASLPATSTVTAATAQPPGKERVNSPPPPSHVHHHLPPTDHPAEATATGQSPSTTMAAEGRHRPGSHHLISPFSGGTQRKRLPLR